MNRIVAALIAGFIAIMLLSSTVFVVDQRKYAIVFALGEVKDVISEPGLYFKLPPPFQNVIYLDKRILTLDTPEPVQAAFDDAVKAGQDRERQKNEGQAYANDVIPKARGAAFRLIQEAEAYRSMVTENAAGNAARFKQVLVEYQKAPVVTRDRMYLETMQQVFSSASKVMVDAKTGSNLLYLPLDKLIAQTAATDAAARAAATPAANTVLPQEAMPTVEVNQRRDSRSSRERESR